MSETDGANKPEPAEDLTKRINELKHAQLAVSQDHAASDRSADGDCQREHWKSRLWLPSSNRHVAGEDRLDTLGRLVAKELHPDFCQLEELMRRESFKMPRPDIERHADRG